MVASGTILLAFVTVQRLTELIVARRNTKALMARGAYEWGASQYPAIVAFHATWLVTLWIFGWDHDVVLPYVYLFAILQIGRGWVLWTLGERWTTRIIIVPGAAPITRGPFRLVRHPNYLVVALEIPCVAMAVGLGWHAVIFGIVGLAVLAWRIRAENEAFARERLRA